MQSHLMRQIYEIDMLKQNHQEQKEAVFNNSKHCTEIQ